MSDYIKKCERASAAAAVAAADQRRTGRQAQIGRPRARDRVAPRASTCALPNGCAHRVHPARTRHGAGLGRIAHGDFAAQIAARPPLPRIHRPAADGAERLRSVAQAASCCRQSRAAARICRQTPRRLPPLNRRQSRKRLHRPSRRQNRTVLRRSPQWSWPRPKSKPVTLGAPAPAKPALIASASAAPSVPQAFVSEAPPPAPDQPQPSRFSIHQLVIALCGALGAASALRFIVGA